MRNTEIKPVNSFFETRLNINFMNAQQGLFNLSKYKLRCSSVDFHRPPELDLSWPLLACKLSVIDFTFHRKKAGEITAIVKTNCHREASC